MKFFHVLLWSGIYFEVINLVIPAMLLRKYAVAIPLLSGVVADIIDSELKQSTPLFSASTPPYPEGQGVWHHPAPFFSGIGMPYLPNDSLGPGICQSVSQEARDAGT